ncbi:MAG: alginate lyase family protein [Ignavibacteriales bacterium]|nr:alginate lyase family protein [Ignavibacteriales bacterium]
MKKIILLTDLFLLFFFCTCVQISFAQAEHPRLILTAGDVNLIKEGLGKYPLFDLSVNQAKDKIETALKNPIDVPIPKDAGGYTHEKHKKNYNEMYLAGVLYSVTKDERYAKFIRDMLMKYADLYPTLKNHPMAAGESVGRLFWQTLNETVWLVHTSQAYDCIYEYLSQKERDKIEKSVLRPMAKFFTEEHAPEFNRIHNHGTWTVTAVGMLGYALHDKDLVEKALYGTKKDGNGGFLKQLDLLFSPDGYYTEGAYYIRYAILPFVLFAQAIENNQPELRIFEYRNQILKKAFYSAMQLTYTDGRFIPFNDALKDMRFTANEMVTALDITYRQYGADHTLLSIAKEQNAVLLNGAGLAVARDLTTFPNPPMFEWKSVELTDGANGDEGAVGILRSGPVSDQTLALLKYPAQGMGHGHFDRLNFIYYNQGRELLQDYGSVRFINIEPKFGGRYMKENNTWAKQTISHNTITVDERSQFEGKLSIAEKNPGERHFFSTSDPNLQVMSGKASNTYPGVQMQRTIAVVKDQKFSEPVVIDIFRVTSDQQHQYDLPFYYMGQFIHTNLKYNGFDKEQKPFGEANGYQYLWKEAEGNADGSAQFTWLNGQRYYSITTSADSTTKVFFTRIGASDPEYNLRREPAVILRTNARSHVYASFLEPHGYFEPVAERSDGATGIVNEVNVVSSTDEATIVEIKGKDSLCWTIMINNGPALDTKNHEVSVNGKIYKWTGNFSIQKH